MLRSEYRPFLWGLAASVIFHVLLFIAVPALREAATRTPHSPAPLVARLTQPPPAAPTAPMPEPKPAPEAVSPPKPPPVAPKRPVEKKRSKALKPAPAPLPAPRSKPPPTPEAPEPPAAAVEPSAAPPPAPAQPVAPAASAPAAPAPAPAPPATIDAPAPQAKSEAPDPGSLQQYRMALARKAAEFKSYPRAARENNWEGEAEIVLAIGGNGALASVSVRSSTGYATLDQQAIEMLTKAKRLVAIPPALRGKEFSVALKVRYSLED